MSLSDRETVRQSTENPYLQYFIGLPSFQEELPFHPSLMTHFRKQLGPDVLRQVNEWMVIEQDDRDDLDDEDGGDSGQLGVRTDSKSRTKAQTTANQGKLLLDATCAPADISYPTDLSLLNEAREKLEKMIDVLHAARERGIRLSGPPLGRPSKTAREEQARIRIERQDAVERNAIEGKFGEGKRLYGLGLIRARLRATSETVIALQLLVMNLERRLRLLLSLVLAWLQRSLTSTALVNS